MAKDGNPPEYPNELPPVKPRDRLHVRLERTKPLEVALSELHAKLVQSTLRCEQVGDSGRYGVALGLRAIEEFLTDVGVPSAAMEPIHMVKAAIHDAKRGVESPIFKPDRRGAGAPPKPLRELEFEGYLAVITECCVQHMRGQKAKAYLKDGSALAERIVRASKLGVKPSATQLREIRERVQTRIAEDTPDVRLYRILMDSDVARSNPLDWATWVANHDWILRPASDFLHNS